VSEGPNINIIDNKWQNRNGSSWIAETLVHNCTCEGKLLLIVCFTWQWATGNVLHWNSEFGRRNKSEDTTGLSTTFLIEISCWHYLSS